MANIIVTIGKDLEIAADDVLHWAAEAEATVTKATPGVLAALGVLAAGIEKSMTDVVTDVKNPLGILLAGPAQLKDFEALWPDVKKFLNSIGITKI